MTALLVGFFSTQHVSFQNSDLLHQKGLDGAHFLSSQLCALVYAFAPTTVWGGGGRGQLLVPGGSRCLSRAWLAYCADEFWLQARERQLTAYRSGQASAHQSCLSWIVSPTGQMPWSC